MSDMIEFSCPHCSREIRTSAQFAGKQGPCPHCGKPVRVELPAGLEVAVMTPPRPTKGATDANPILAGFIGAIVTVALYGVFIILPSGNYIHDLFTQRGPVQFISTFVTCWGLSILALKYLAVKKQLGYVGRELQMLPLESGVQVTSHNVDSFLRHLNGLPEEARESIVGARIRGALEHFRARNDVPEVQAYLASQANIDASSVDSGYTLLRCFIWLIPILGFIGTVTGISSAVSNLANSLEVANTAETSTTDPAEGPKEEVSDLGALMIQGMGGVTSGLATAFDTTFVGLVFAAVLLFPTESLKRIEYGMLDRVEGFTYDTLLRRFADDNSSDALSPDVARLLEPVFKRHQQWLLEWQTRVSELGTVIGRDFERHIAAAQQHLQGLQTSKENEVLALAQSLGGAMESTNTSVANLKDAATDISHSLQTTIAAATELQSYLSSNTAALKQTAEQWRGLHQADGAHGNDSFGLAIEKLSSAADRLSQAASLVQSDAHAGQNGGARRRGWFGK